MIIYAWTIGLILATFGTYIWLIYDMIWWYDWYDWYDWNSPDVSVRYYLGTGFARVKGGETISKLYVFHIFPNLGWASNLCSFQVQNCTHFTEP